MKRLPIDGPYSFALDERAGQLHVTNNLHRALKASSLGSRLHAIFEVIAGMVLFGMRNLWAAVVLFALISKAPNFADFLLLLALAYGFRRFMDFLLQPGLVKQYGIPFEYIFSREALTIEVRPRQPKGSDSYYLPYTDLAVFYVDTLKPGGYIAFQVPSRGESDSFNEWLKSVAPLRETSMGDIAKIGKEIDKWLTCRRKEFSTKELQAAIRSKADGSSA